MNLEKENLNLAKEIMKLLIKKQKEPYDYVNPYFLEDISKLLEEYYQIENDDVEEWINNMWLT